MSSPHRVDLHPQLPVTGPVDASTGHVTMRFPASLRSLLAALILVLAPGLLQAQEPNLQSPPDQIDYPRGDVFISGLDAVWTATGEVLEGASILIRGGIIEAIGVDLEAPEGIRVIQGSGRTAIPGIVDEHSHTAQVGTNEGSAPLVPEVRVIEALDPSSFNIFRALQGGVTTARIMHGSSNPIGGQSAVVKMRWGMDRVQDLLVPGAPSAVKFALGENVTRKAQQGRGPASRFPASRPGVEAIYVQAFTAAQEYRDLWAEYEANPGAFDAAPRRDLRLEALVDIMEDRIRVHAHSYRNDEILMLMRVAERFGFTIDNFTHALEAYRIADELREHGAGSSTFSDWWQFKLESYDAIPYNATITNERGVLTALNSDLTWLQPFMTWEIPKPVQYGGASREDALRMLTLNPAIMLGVEDMVGSLEVGKHGDVVLLTGDPFDAFTRVEHTIIEGVSFYDSNAEREYRGEPLNELPVLSRDRYMVADAAMLAGSVAGSVDVADLEPLHPDVETVALVGATIHPVTGTPIEDGVIVLAGGYIQAVGSRAEVEIPAGAREVDASGRQIWPGMIDPLTHLGLFEFGAVSQATDRGELGSFNPHIKALPGYQPHGRAPFVARARGITSTLTAQSGGIIEGMGSVVDLQGDTWERAEIRGEGALVINLPVPSQAPGGRALDTFSDHHHEDGGRQVVWAGDVFFQAGHDADHSHGEDMGGATPRPFGAAVEDLRARRNDGPDPALDTTDNLTELVAFLNRARDYMEAPGQSSRPADAPFEANVWGGDIVVLEAMMPVLRGEVPVFFRADSEWQIRHVILLAEEFPELDVVIVGGVQAFRVVDEIAASGLPVVLTRTRNPTPDRDDPVTASMMNPAILQQAGVTLVFATDESADVRNLPEHAGIAVAHGLPLQAAIEGVTINAARVLGLGDRMGSLEAGKRADLIVTDGHPLQPLTRIEGMFIGGIEVDPRDNDHSRAYEKFIAR